MTMPNRLLPFVLLALLAAACAPSATTAPGPQTPHEPSNTEAALLPSQLPPQATGAVAGSPILALRQDQTIELVDSATGQTLAQLALPPEATQDVGFALSGDGQHLFYAPQVGPALLFNLADGSVHSIEAYAQWQAGQRLNRIAWAPSHDWVSIYTSRDDGGNSLWLYSLVLDDFAYVTEILGPPHWGQANQIWFQHESGEAVLFDPETGSETAWPALDDGQALALLAAQGPAADAFACVQCVYPQLGLLAGYTSYAEDSSQVDYQLIDWATQTVLPVARFHTQRSVPLDYNLDVSAMLPLADGYLLFVHERFDGLSDNPQERFYTVRSAAGSQPAEFSDADDAPKLLNVMPVVLSPDGAQFAGYRIAEQDYIPWFAGVVVVDIASLEIVSEYLLPAQVAGFYPPKSLFGVDLVWP